ncbi:MAG: hypothetical protein M0Q26_13935 [Chitinophagaceae bacterium]|nr:hypothetical protein [Chitinophagaceae bacterium]MDP1763449.1 hypothetical protein [Sediminibacterium sp.]
MKKQVTYQELGEIVTSMDTLRRNNPALKLLLGHKMEDFYIKNQLRIDNISRRIAELVKTYVKHDEDGNPMFVKTDKEEEFDFEDPLDKQKYLRDLNAFMKISFEIIL